VAADLEIRIGAELTEINRALKQLRGDLAGLGQVAQRAGSGRPLAGLETGAGAAMGQVKALAVGLLGIQTILTAIRTADDLASLNARLRLVTDGAEAFNRAQVELFEIAQRSRSGLAGTVDLFTKIANATKDAKVGQEVVLQVTESIQKLGVISGAAGQASEAALMQLGQGLASGTLRGEELNSVMEQTPALADAIAKGMGITRGELRKYGEEGKITAEQVIKALQSQKAEIDRQFATLPTTVGQATTLLSNAVQRIVGVFDQTAGATGGLAEAITALAELLSSDAVVGAVVEFAATWGNAFALIVKDVGDAVAFIRQATQDIAGSGEDLVALLLRAFRELPVNLRTIVRIVTVTFAGMVDSFIADAKLMKEAFAAIFTDDTVEAAIARRNARVQAALGAVKASIDDALGDREKALAQAKDARQAATSALQRGRQATGATSTGKFRPPEPDKGAAAKAEALRKAQLDAEEKLLADSAKRQLSILETLYQDATISAANYYAERQRLEIEALDRQIAVEREKAKAGGADRVKALAEIQLLERAKGDAQRKALRDQAEDATKLEREIGQLRIQELENAGDTATAVRLRMEAQFAELVKRMEAEGNEAGVKIIRGLIDTGVARAQFADLKREFDRITEDLQRRQAAIADQQQAGGLAPDTANQQQAAARTEAIAQLEVLNAKLQELALRTNDPQIVAGAQAAADALRRMAIDGATGIDAAVIQLRAALANLERDFAKTATGAGVDALTNLFTDLASGSKSAGDAIKDFVRSFAASMAQIAARALATYLVLQLLEAIFPGAGKLVAATGNVAANVKHSGGRVGQGTRRDVSPLLFAGAPRFHDGSGVLGLKPGEIPAILQEGERVQSRAEVQAGQQQGGGAGYRIVNVVDPTLVEGYLQSAAGERVILNTISRNPGQVRQLIGR